MTNKTGGGGGGGGGLCSSYTKNPKSFRCTHMPLKNPARMGIENENMVSSTAADFSIIRDGSFFNVMIIGLQDKGRN